MKNFIHPRFYALLILVFFIFGCSSTIPYFYSDNSNREFVVLGEVSYVGKIIYFAMLGSGGATFQELLNEAKSKYNADYVINVTIDSTSKYNILTLLGFWSQTYTMRGTAISYIQRNSEGEIISRSTHNSEISSRTTSENNILIPIELLMSFPFYNSLLCFYLKNYARFISI